MNALSAILHVLLVVGVFLTAYRLTTLVLGAIF